MGRAIIGTVVAVLIFAGISAIGPPPESQPSESPQSPELKVLNRLVGSWSIELVELQANGGKKESTSTLVAQWSLQGQYLESRITDSDGKEVALNLTTYDSDAGVYQAWIFSPDSAKPTPFTMRWIESNNYFLAKIDLGNGITMQTTTRFHGNDRYEFSGATKDASGNVRGGLVGTAIREK